MKFHLNTGDLADRRRISGQLRTSANMESVIQVDFFTLFSSVAAMLGSPGQAQSSSGLTFEMCTVSAVFGRPTTALGMPSLMLSPCTVAVKAVVLKGCVSKL